MDKIDILGHLKSHCLVEVVDEVPFGHLRAATKLVYVDGSGIDLFAESGFPADSITLSDLGQTFSTLLEHQFRPWRTKSQLQAIKETSGALGVMLTDDKLHLEINSLTQLDDALFRLGQACIRVSCFVFTQKSSAQAASFKDEVHAELIQWGLPIDPDVTLHGPYGKPIEVDFRVQGMTRRSSVLTMSGSNVTTVHTRANEILSRWVDLHEAGHEDQMLTIYDNRKSFYRSEDLRRLERYSAVEPISNEVAIRSLLAA